MAKEIYLYSPVYDFVAEDLISKMEENAGEDVVIRTNSPGGSVFAGWGIIAKMKERAGKVKIKVDGYAASMSLFMLLFADEVTALEVSQFVMHRADMYVSSPEAQKWLDGINKDLYDKFKAKINNDKLKELKGVTLKDIFEPTQRIDVTLTAKEAKAIGLVDKIVKVDPNEVKALNESMWRVAAEVTKDKDDNKNQNDKNMTQAELKAKFPELYAQIVAEGVTQEKDRVEACMAFLEIDPAGVKAAIESGKPLTQKQMAEFTVKALSKDSLKKVEANSEGAEKTKTDEEKDKPKDEKEKNVDAFQKDVLAKMGKKQAA